MSRRFAMSRIGSATVGVATAVALTIAVPVSAHPKDHPAAPSALARHILTLITGDVIEVHSLSDGDTTATVKSSADRRRVGYASRNVDGQLYVVPNDASPLIAAGKLDEELFNLTTLVAGGYDDGRSATLPLIVQYEAGQAVAALPGTTSHVTLDSINAQSVQEDKGQASVFWTALAGKEPGKPGVAAADQVRKIWLNRKVHADLAESVPQVGAPQAWAGGHDGTGVTVAVLDTGIDATHADLDDGKVVTAANFSSDPDTLDHNGHGTHVASTVAGTGEATPIVRKGVAPGARLLNAKVLDRNGNGFEDKIIKGLEWAANQGADVISISIGTFTPAEGPDPMTQAIDSVSRTNGVLVVVAAGNLGGDESTITTPGWADEALTVGAVDKQDALAPYSSRGPRRGDFAVKPDLTAPGSDIVAARAAGSTLGPIVDGVYQQLSGTSMATPHVAGAAAVLAQKNPGHTYRQLRDTIISTAKIHGGQTMHQQGGGRLDLARAYSQQVYASPGTLNLGFLSWPHTDQQPVTKTVTYVNDSAADVTFQLILGVSGKSGSAPEGMFTLNQPSVTIPAHGTASVDVTVNPKIGRPDLYGGHLLALAGDTVVHTSVGTYLEPEMYNVTVSGIARDGRPAAVISSIQLWGLDDRYYVTKNLSPSSSTVTFRAPPGTYNLAGYLGTADAANQFATELTLVVEPERQITGDTSITLDARPAVPIVVNTPRPATMDSFTLSYYRYHQGRAVINQFLNVPPIRAYAVPTTTPVTKGDFEFFTRWDLVAPVSDATASPYAYDLLLPEKQRIPQSLTYTVDGGNTAEIDTQYYADTPGVVGTDVRAFKRPWPVPTGAFSAARQLPLPLRRTYYVSANDTQWWHIANAKNPSEGEFRNAFTQHAPGSRQAERWFGRVSRPGASTLFFTQATRTGDEFRFALFPHSDSDGHIGWESAGDVQSSKLYVGSELLKETSSFLPLQTFPALPRPATYRLVFNGKRSTAWSRYSTETNTVWTFASNPPPAGQEGRPPLLQVDYTLALDEYNRAPDRTTYTFTVNIGRVPGATGPAVTNIRAWMSVNDGGTWTQITLQNLGNGRVRASVPHPAVGGTTGAVSLRVTATDTAGNSIDQTVYRAYGLKAG